MGSLLPYDLPMILKTGYRASPAGTLVRIASGWVSPHQIYRYVSTLRFSEGDEAGVRFYNREALAVGLGSQLPYALQAIPKADYRASLAGALVLIASS